MCMIITVADHDHDQHPELYVHDDNHGHSNKIFNYNDDHVRHCAQALYYTYVGTRSYTLFPCALTLSNLLRYACLYGKQKAQLIYTT